MAMRVKPTGDFRNALFAIHRRSKQEIDDDQLAKELAKLEDDKLEWIVTVVPHFWDEPQGSKISRKLGKIREDVQSGK